MTANDAYFELIKVYPQFNIVACYEYDSRFVFEIRQNGVESDEPQFDSLISVDKTTGKISYLEVNSSVIMGVDTKEDLILDEEGNVIDPEDQEYKQNHDLDQ